ncbi:MAG TPA: MFS transporter [Solirubrobacteraceae bacterium]
MGLSSLPRLVGATLFVDMAAYSAITPMLPDFADRLDLSKAQAGVLGASYAAGTFAAAIPGGWLAARVGGRTTMLAGLICMGLAALVFGVGGDVAVLDPARFVQGAGGALTWSGALAWLVSVTPRERRGAVIGSALGAAIAGTLAGPALGALAEAVGTFAVFAGFVGLAAVLCAFALRLPASAPAFRAGRGDLARLARDTRVHTGMWLIAFPGLAFGVIYVLGPLRFDDLGAGVGTIAGIFLVAAAAEAAMSPVAGRLSDRYGHFAPMRYGLAATVVLVALLTLPRGVALLAAGIVALAPALGTLWAPALALISDALEARGLEPALGYGLSNLAWALGAAAGGAGGSALAAATSDAVPYLLLAALAALTLAGVSRVRTPVPA